MDSIVRFFIVQIITCLSLALAWYTGKDGAQWSGLPVLFICAGLAIIINWLAFIPSAIAKTEKFYDLTGSVTYGVVTLAAVLMVGSMDPLSLIVAGMVLVWCGRLGSMLFSRISRDGEDKRFKEIRNNPLRFFGAWTIQGVWVVVTAICALAIIVSQEEKTIGLFTYIGMGMWIIGFVCEVVADNQKLAFKAQAENKGKFINSGLWAWSQHPNYFGEILLWSGIAVIAIPILSGTAMLAYISPFFVAFLLLKVSGIPLLDKQAKERWGEDEAYQEYSRHTSKLIPLPPKR